MPSIASKNLWTALHHRGYYQEPYPPFHEESAMRQCLRTLAWATALTLSVGAAGADAACCYFSAKNADILQPAQKVFITWDPSEKMETFTVQPKFEGNALISAW